jgi:hypothetical protein
MIAQLLIAPALDVLDEIPSGPLDTGGGAFCPTLLKSSYFAKLVVKPALTALSWFDQGSLQQHHVSIRDMVCDILNVLQIARVLSFVEAEAQTTSANFKNYGF